MADIAELTVRIKADAAQLSAEMNKVKGVVAQATGNGSGGMGASFVGLKSQMLSLVPALSVAAFVSYAKGALDAAGNIVDLSERIGFSAETLSALEESLATSGGSLEQFGTSVGTLSNQLGAALKGDETAIKAFDALGLSVKNLSKLDQESRFYAVADALSKVGDSAVRTEAGRNLLGTGFASMNPTLAAAGGNMRAYVEGQTAMGKGLTKEKLAQLDNLGDTFARVGLKIRNFLLTAINDATEGFLRLFGVASDANTAELEGKISKLKNELAKPANQQVRDRMGNVVSSNSEQELKKLEGQLAIQKQIEEKNNKPVDTKTDPKGSNKDLIGLKDSAKSIEAAKKSLADFNTETERRQKISLMMPKEQAGMEAYYKTLDLAQKAGIKNAEDIAEKNRTVAESNYAIKEAQDEARRSAQLLTDKLSDGLTSAIMDFKNAGDAASQFAKSIASMIIQKSIATPIANALTGGSSGGGGIIGSLFSSMGLPSFAVGSPNIPNDMVAQIHKGEMIIPRVQADAIRNGNSGSGQSVIVQQVFHISPGVPELINARIREASPVIASAAHDAVFASMQRGGSASKIAGLR